MKTIGIIALCILALVGVLALIPGGQATVSHIIDAFTMRLNSNPPAYIKDVVAYKEGDSLVIYLTLADTSGALTSADGTLIVTIREEGKTLWSVAPTIKRSQFETTRVGRGAFEHTTLLLSVGRIAEREFTRQRRADRVTVDVTFITNSARLTGSRDVWF
jgi:hypothetical protein